MLARKGNTDLKHGFKALDFMGLFMPIEGYLCKCGRWHDIRDPEYKEHWYLNR